jgi:multimeric flavodoxin WrbA
MNVVAFNGSPRKDGNTAALIQTVLDVLRAEGIEGRMVQIGGKKIRGCSACFQCHDKKDRRCAIEKDKLNGWIAAMEGAAGIILGSPTYFASMSPELKALIDRAGMVAKANGDMFKRKVGAAVVAVRRAGSVHTFDSINHFFTISQMIIPGSSYWNMGFGLEKGEAVKDVEGIDTMKTLGKNMAWLLKKLHD